MTVSIHAEPFRSWFIEGAPLMRAHWEEVANWRDEVPLEVDVVRACAMEERAELRAWTVRDAGELAGYLVCLIGPHLHYRTTIHGWVDAVYLVPGLRSTGHGRALIERAIADLREAGVRRLACHVKLGYDFGPLLEQLGFIATETIWEARL